MVQELTGGEEGSLQGRPDVLLIQYAEDLQDPGVHVDLKALSTDLLRIAPLTAMTRATIGECRTTSPRGELFLVLDRDLLTIECTHEPPHSRPLP